MKKVMILFSLTMSFQLFAESQVFNLSKNVYNDMPYTPIYMDQGALVYNIDYASVKALIPQLEKTFNLKLEDRGESHITVVTPPEFGGWFHPQNYGLHNVFEPNELHRRYKTIIQNKAFKIKCIGSQSKDENTVFYLVVETNQLRELRRDLNREYRNRLLNSDITPNFDPEAWYPHITIGYKGGDVHGVSKGPETCLKNSQLVID